MATKTKKKEINFIITDYDKNGNVIKDLSKVVVPLEMQLELLKELNNLRRRRWSHVPRNNQKVNLVLEYVLLWEQEDRQE